MPQAIPLGRTHYVLFLRYPPGPGKPRFETEAWTQEFKPPFRRGVGSVARLGRLGVQWGRWTQIPSPETSMTDGTSAPGRHPSSSDGVRLIEPEEIEQISDMVQDGWRPPIWHWRHWLDLALPMLVRLDLVRVNAYAENHWKRPRWLPKQRPTLRIVPDDPMFSDDMVDEDWSEVAPIPKCGHQCDQVHTMEPPCRWARDYNADGTPA